MSKLAESFCHLPAIRCVEHCALRAIHSYQPASEHCPAAFRVPLFESPMYE